MDNDLDDGDVDVTLGENNDAKVDGLMKDDVGPTDGNEAGIDAEVGLGSNEL